MGRDHRGSHLGIRWHQLEATRERPRGFLCLSLRHQHRSPRATLRCNRQAQQRTTEVVPRNRVIGPQTHVVLQMGHRRTFLAEFVAVGTGDAKQGQPSGSRRVDGPRQSLLRGGGGGRQVP